VRCPDIEHLSTDFGIITYPNPSTGQFTIEKPEGLHKDIQIRVVDSASRLILEKVIPVHLRKLELDIRNYSEGIY
jgi:hypothetical protein